jgi:Na+-driven multidrug efflux pump
MEFQMKKVYYNTQLVLVFLIIARVIADSFLGFLSEEKLSIDILERVKHYTSPMIMLLMLYFIYTNSLSNIQDKISDSHLCRFYR